VELRGLKQHVWHDGHVHMNLYEAIKSNKPLFDVFVAKQEYGGKRDRFGRFLYEFSSNKNALEPVGSSILLTKMFCMLSGLVIMSLQLV